ncbi:hypothetical protein SteCoe_23526 [Stentor coeruleus]|uniref:Uncharacterized protein n=1 Tax=Stentor coeruleus TaxID=5963 RepID=A0A1R2BJN5_9CILI|nr:hypothetical protein SteCoe_23526 [Stentor coeruleus]
MEIQYSGNYQGIYDESNIKYTNLIRILNDNNIKVLISDIEKVWVKEACRNCRVTLIINPHPDDMNYFFTSIIYDEICELRVFTCCFDMDIEKFGVCGKFYIENSRPVGILPEALGKEYEKSIRKIVRIWEMWSEDYLVVPAGGFFEIQLCRVLGDCELKRVFWEFLRKFVNKMPKPKALWKKFLLEFSYGKDFSFRIDMGDIGKAEIIYENDNEYVEAFSVKLEVLRKFLEVSLQISRIEGVIVNRKAKE